MSINFGLSPCKESWKNVSPVPPKEFVCGFCNKFVASNTGYVSYPSSKQSVRICPNCNIPTFFDYHNRHFPSASEWDALDSLPQDIAHLMGEIRGAYSMGAYTLISLGCRKILMHISVEKGAEKNKNFFYYVEFLSENHYMPPNGKRWVDYLRRKGNEINHDIVISSKEDASALIEFATMLLKFVYEMPSKIPFVENTKNQKQSESIAPLN